MYKLLFLLIVSITSAQNYRFVYEYKMKPDLSKKDSVVTDYMNLDTDGKKSYFYNAVKYERDSAYAASKSYKDLLTAKSYDQNLSYMVEKDYREKTMNFYDKFKTVSLRIAETEMPKWNIEKDDAEINGIHCQKATSVYKGRTWEAWFSKDYAVSDGPYKFTGLPGLVVKIRDLEDQHVFNLIQIKKINSVFPFLPKSPKKVTFAEYKKAMANFFFTIQDIEGINVNKQDEKMDIQLKDGFILKVGTGELKKMKNMDEEIARRLKRSNNLIERQ